MTFCCQYQQILTGTDDDNIVVGRLTHFKGVKGKLNSGGLYAR